MFGFGKKKKKKTEEAVYEIQESIADEIIEENENEEEEDGTNIDEQDMLLYIITDKKTTGLLNYMRESGLKVNKILASINQARDILLIQSQPCRFVIMDTGTGRFTSTKVRQELIDVLGICDESTRVSVFYTDSVIKSEATRVFGKTGISIDWHKYVNTVQTVATLLQSNEKYILDYSASDLEELITMDDLNKIKGEKINSDIPESIRYININAQMIQDRIEAEPNSLIEEFEVSY